jgi:hypothetical protein
MLSGFTLSEGYGGAGGGVWSGSTATVISNCVVSANVASGTWETGKGGGAYGGTLINCTLAGNRALSQSEYFGGTAAALTKACSTIVR